MGFDFERSKQIWNDLVFKEGTLTLLKKLRDAAAACPNPHYRTTLRLWADELQHAIKEFGNTPDEDNLRYLNSCWAVATRLLKQTPATPEPQAPLSGPSEPARLAA